MIAALLTSRMAFSTPTVPRWDHLFALGIFLRRGVCNAYLLGGFSNLLPSPDLAVSGNAVFSMLFLTTAAFVLINFFTQKGLPQPFARGVDWQLVPASVLVLFAVWILAGLALACSTPD